MTSLVDFGDILSLTKLIGNKGHILITSRITPLNTSSRKGQLAVENTEMFGLQLAAIDKLVLFLPCSEKTLQLFKMNRNDPNFHAVRNASM